jgi:hypothetical protein
MIKQGNESIQSQIILNNKPISGIYNTEKALHIKHKFRALRDVSTDEVVNSLFSYDYFNNNENINNNNSIRRNLFLLYVYDYFNLNIISDFEYYLLINNCKILNTDVEYIHFLFKGGNIYFHIISDLIKNHNILSEISDDNSNSLKNDFTKFFKVSDFDFTVNLFCVNHEKFLKIKEYLIKFLIKKLEEITLFFNSYLIDKFSNTPSNYINIKDDSITIKNNTLPLNTLPIQNLNDPINTHSAKRNNYEETMMIKKCYT